MRFGLQLSFQLFGLVSAIDLLRVQVLAHHLSVIFDVVSEDGLVLIEHSVEEVHTLLLFVFNAGCVHIRVLQ